MKIEEVIAINAHDHDRKPYYALILSIFWNCCFLFLLFFVARQQQKHSFNVAAEPLVVFQNPLMPSPVPQNTPLSPSAQQPQTLQQVALQQPQDFTNPAHDQLNYLVQQIISYGNGSWGAVVSAVDDIPGNPPTASTEPEVAAPELAAEPAQETADNGANESAESTDKKPEAQEESTPPLSHEDQEILQETARTIATTMPAEKTICVPAVSHGGNNNRGSGSRSAGPSIRSTKSNSLTIADLAHSFMKQVHNEKQIKYHYDPQQNRGGMPGVYSPAKNNCSGKELALQMYATKVFMMMQQSAHALSSLIYANADFTEQSLLEITINYDGKLLRVALNPPIHEKDVELAVQKIVERVGLFPPIPKHFNTDSMTLTFPLNIQGAKGFGRYSLSYSAGGRP